MLSLPATAGANLIVSLINQVSVTSDADQECEAKSDPLGRNKLRGRRWLKHKWLHRSGPLPFVQAVPRSPAPEACRHLRPGNWPRGGSTKLSKLSESISETLRLIAQ